MKCPTCGSEDQTGKFCASCGAALKAGCASCGAALPAGSRFCTQCGAAAGGRRGRGTGLPPWPWIAAGTAVLVILLLFLLPRSADRAGAPSMTGPGGGGVPAGAVIEGGDGLLSSDMRSNADRLYNRIMAAAEQGNRAEVEQFMPMAIQAYGMVEDLDADGLYHLALLHLTAGDPGQALATAERILRDAPDHILGLGVGGAAAEEAGDQDRARALYRRLLDAYATEATKPLREYVDHQRMLPEYRRVAREALGESG
ncbi:MAG TPA: zinc ribbon domain-containing protein [Longimicrobiales bacterium]|nr:zinc ribbon domain-containing protein [Longimicrobiales bacterium]